MGHRQTWQRRRYLQHTHTLSRLSHGSERTLAAPGLGRERGPARRTDGQLRGGTPQHRRGTRGVPGPRENKPRVQGRLHHAEQGRGGGLLLRTGHGQEAPHHGPHIHWRCTLIARPHHQVRGDSQGVRTQGHIPPLLHGRTRHRPQERHHVHREAHAGVR